MESPLGQVQIIALFDVWKQALDAILESFVVQPNPTFEWYLAQRGVYQGIQRAASLQLSQLPESYSPELKEMLAQKVRLVAIRPAPISASQYQKRETR
jgi:hypothetical protein